MNQSNDIANNIEIDLIKWMNDGLLRFNDFLIEASNFSALSKQITDSIKAETDLSPITAPFRFAGTEASPFAAIGMNYGNLCHRSAILTVLLGVEEFLFAPYLALLLAKAGKDSGGLVPQKTTDDIIEECNRQKRRGHIWYKFEKESKILGLSFANEEQFESLIHMRNCLVHRGGLVTHEDIKDKNILIVTWIEAKLFADETEILRLPVGPFNEPKQIRLKMNKNFREYRLGDRIVFNDTDVQSICWTAHQFVNDVVRKCAHSLVETYSLPITASSDT